MRELDFDHVTPFRPITRLNFWIIKFLRGYPYKKYTIGFVIYGWGLSYLGGICHMWGGLSYMGIKSYSRRISSRYLSKKEPIFDKPHPYMTNPAQKWQFKLDGVCHRVLSNMGPYLLRYRDEKRREYLLYGICHQGLSYMGSIPDLTNPTHVWQTPLILGG